MAALCSKSAVTLTRFEKVLERSTAVPPLIVSTHTHTHTWLPAGVGGVCITKVLACLSLTRLKF